MRVIVTGAAGQLGQDVVQRLQQCAHTPIPTDMPQLDITRKEDVLSFFCRQNADAVIHCAAWTAVDRAETEPEAARLVNADGTRNVAEAAERCGMKMILISTDYVYPGVGFRPQTETTPPAPCNVYGLTKLEGETAAAAVCSKLFIVRTSWVFGTGGQNFVRTMLRLSETHDAVRVIADQIGSPTFTEDLAVLLCEMLGTELYGVYNATNEGFCSWCSFAWEIFRRAGRTTLALPITTEAYAAPAMRPKNSRMSKQKLIRAGFQPLPPWQDALERYLSKSGIEPPA